MRYEESKVAMKKQGVQQCLTCRKKTHGRIEDREPCEQIPPPIVQYNIEIKI